MAWPDGGENEVVKTIGATGCDYATISSWEADTDNDCTTGWGTGDYKDPCSPVGVCCDNGTYNETMHISGATTDSTHYRRLTVAPASRHNGTAYSGATVVNDAGYGVKVSDKYAVFEWLVVTGAGYNLSSFYCPADSRQMFRNVICTYTGGNAFNVDHSGTGAEVYYRNCIAHDMIHYGFWGTGPSNTFLQNCTTYGSLTWQVYSAHCTNVIAISTDASPHPFNSCTGDYNISNGSDAPGEHSINGVSADQLFVSTTPGAIDLHLKDDSTSASAAGTDLSAYFTDDIDGDVRSDWDIGADEYVAGLMPLSGTASGQSSASATLSGVADVLPDSGYATATVTNPASDLDEFPLLVDLSKMPTEWWDAVDTTDATKGRAAKDDGTELPCDWEDFDPSTKTGWVWVRWSGTLSSSGTQTLRIYPPQAANASYAPSDLYGSQNVWDSNYVAVWHMNESSGTVHDATANGSDATPHGGPTYEQSGKIGNAVYFDGSGDYFSGTGFAFSGGFTVEAWAKPDDTDADRRLFYQYDSGEGYFLTQYNEDSGVWRFTCFASGTYKDCFSSAPPTGSWQYVVGTRDDSGNLTLYVDGVAQADTEILGGAIDAAPFFIGCDVNQLHQFAGVMDELRISSVARSADWISHSYDQVNDQDAFWNLSGGTWTWNAAGAILSLSGTTGGQSSTSAVLGVDWSLAGSVAAQASCAAALGLDLCLAGSAAGQAGADGAAGLDLGLIGATAGQSSVDGAIGLDLGLAGSTAGQADAVGTARLKQGLIGLTAGLASTAGVVGLDLGLSGATAGQSDSDAILALDVGLIGSTAGSASADGLLGVDFFLAGSVAAQAACAGALGLDMPLAGMSAGQAGVSGDLTLARMLALAGIAAGQSGISGDLALALGLAGKTAGQSGAEAVSRLALGLSGSALGQSIIEAVLALDLALAGVAAGLSEALGSLSVPEEYLALALEQDPEVRTLICNVLVKTLSATTTTETLGCNVRIQGD